MYPWVSGRRNSFPVGKPRLLPWPRPHPHLGLQGLNQEDVEPYSPKLSILRALQILSLAPTSQGHLSHSYRLGLLPVPALSRPPWLQISAVLFSYDPGSPDTPLERAPPHRPLACPPRHASRPPNWPVLLLKVSQPAPTPASQFSRALRRDSQRFELYVCAQGTRGKKLVLSC